MPPSGKTHSCTKHMVRFFVTFGLQGIIWLSPLYRRWLVAAWHARALRLQWALPSCPYGGRRLAGLWVWNGAGEVLRWEDGEVRSIIHQHPLHKRGEILLRTDTGQACFGFCIQAGTIKVAQGAAQKIHVARQL